MMHQTKFKRKPKAKEREEVLTNIANCYFTLIARIQDWNHRKMIDDSSEAKQSGSNATQRTCRTVKYVRHHDNAPSRLLLGGIFSSSSQSNHPLLVLWQKRRWCKVCTSVLLHRVYFT
eukprot:scaffold14389_cov151-Skeletonema_marinoi.AAC.7